MSKFFVNSNQINEKKITIIGSSVNHIRNVLRLKINEQIQICDIDSNINYICSIENILKDSVICNIIQKLQDTTESNVYINIIQGIPKSDKMEWIIEKCTEIGVSEFTPLRMERCVVKIEDEKTQEKKIARWQKIAESAAMQSQRDFIPYVRKIENFKNLMETVKEYDLALVAYEEEKDITIKEELKKIYNSKKEKLKIAVIIGPEGRNQQRRNSSNKTMEYTYYNFRKKNFKNRNSTYCNFINNNV